MLLWSSRPVSVILDSRIMNEESNVIHYGYDHDCYQHSKKVDFLGTI